MFSELGTRRYVQLKLEGSYKTRFLEDKVKDTLVYKLNWTKQELERGLAPREVYEKLLAKAEKQEELNPDDTEFRLIAEEVRKHYLIGRFQTHALNLSGLE